MRKTTNHSTIQQDIEMPEHYVDLATDTTEMEVNGPDALGEWVMAKVQDWRNDYDSNYRQKHDEYYRLWRGIWAGEDKTRQSERSKLIAPALQQAVESNVADLEEATFGRGRWFNITDDVMDEDHKDVVALRKRLQEDFALANVPVDLSEAALIGAVFGTGIIEIDVQEIKHQKPATREAMGRAVVTFGVETEDRVIVKGIPTMPKNFVIDPNATCIEDALGCASDRFVSRHKIVELQEAGVYRNAEIGTSASDLEIEADKTLTSFEHDKIRLVKYYGLVPRHLLEDAMTEEDEEIVSLSGEEAEDSYYVEAIVVLANDGVLLKAEENPFMFQDRPVVAFQWDVVPGKFMGRGVCEKGYNSQKALDAELRARADALALTTAPMLALDATRMPRGAKPQVRPGKNLVTNGNPNEILMPFNFGKLDQITFSQAAELQKMVGQATGAIEASGLPAAAARGEATAAGMSMAMSAVMKRHRRTLMNYQNNMVAAFVKKAAHRYMQYAPELYPSRDYKFSVYSTLGMVAREYEVSQMTQLMQVVDGPARDVLLDATIETMALSNSEETVAALEQARQPNPEAQQMQMRDAEAEIKFKESQSVALEGQGRESNARAVKYLAEAKAVPQNTKIDQIKAVADLKQQDDDAKDFEQRMRIADLFIKDRETQIKEAESGIRQEKEKKAAAAEENERAAGQELAGMMNEQPATPPSV
jgi:hypothetical protein